MSTTFSAKQVATRIGTDAKTLRKFLRSPSSPYIAVGQGKRYEFPAADIAEIKAAFAKWQSKGPAKPKAKLETIDFPPAPVQGTPHTVVMGDKGKCLKCSGPANSPLHVKPERRKRDNDSARRTREAATFSSFDDPEADWHEFGEGEEPSEADLAEIDDLLEDLDD